MVNDKNGQAFALIQDTWQFWKTFGDLELRTEHDWKAVMGRATSIIDKYANTPYQEPAKAFALAVFAWLEEKARREVAEKCCLQ